jgi:hypothetical protein
MGVLLNTPRKAYALQERVRCAGGGTGFVEPFSEETPSHACYSSSPYRTTSYKGGLALAAPVAPDALNTPST